MKRSTLVISILLGLAFLSVIAIIIVIALQPIAGPRRASSGLGGGDAIAFIPLSGAIADGEGTSLLAGGSGITPDFVRHQLEKAENDPAVKAVIIKLDSPGGAVGASQEIAELIKEEKKSKPVVIFCGDTVASGAYYISSQASKIVAKPGSLVGSIGVISQIPDLTGLYDKLGIKMQTIKSGKNKDMFERTLTPEERQKFQTMSDELYNQFVSDVARGRKLKREKVLGLATGEVFTAASAKQLGLVDEIGGYQKAIDTAAELANIENPVVIEYQPSFFEEFFGGPIESIKNFLRTGILGPELSLIEYMNSKYGVPEYRYYGGQ
ncbi:MAG: signal peptide peptidase SppA [Firmicutes bacterium]|nr:signal peptide peptidase SppA [Bacillota bacterium]